MGRAVFAKFYEENEMTPGLRNHKEASLRVAIPDGVPEELREGIREIVALQSESQGKGHATKLMHEVCTEADVYGKVLFLQPQPFDDGMDADKLEQFYKKFGFEKIQDEPVVLMARKLFHQ